MAVGWDPITSIGKSAADAVFGALWTEIGSACRSVTTALWHAVTSSTDISFTSAAWRGQATQGLLTVVGELSAALMLLMVILAVIRAASRGEPGAAARAVLVDLPISCIGAVALVGITAVVTAASDQAADAIMRLGPSAAMTSFAAHLPAVITHLQFVGGVGGILFLLGAFLVWLELLVRAGLVYLMVATGPLLLAMRVFPSFAPAWKKFAETGVAVIMSKLWVAIALVLGLSLTTGGVATTASSVGQNVGQLLAGIGMMALAAFAPFVILRFVPVLGSALVAQGISRMPGRAAMQGVQMAYYGQGLARMAGVRGGAGAGAAMPGGNGVGPGPQGRPPAGTAGGQPPPTGPGPTQGPGPGPGPVPGPAPGPGPTPLPGLGPDDDDLPPAAGPGRPAGGTGPPGRRAPSLAGSGARPATSRGTADGEVRSEPAAAGARPIRPRVEDAARGEPGRATSRARQAPTPRGDTPVNGDRDVRPGASRDVAGGRR